MTKLEACYEVLCRTDFKISENRQTCGGAVRHQAADRGNAQLLPKNTQNVAHLDLPQGKSANDGDRGLSTCVSARVHQHGEKGGENGIGADGGLVVGDDGTGKGS